MKRGSLIGRPFTGHSGGVDAQAVTELDGRPVILSAGRDKTLRIWDLRTGAPVGPPFTGHHGRVLALTMAEQDGRLVPLSAVRSAATTVRFVVSRRQRWTVGRLPSLAETMERCASGSWGVRLWPAGHGPVTTVQSMLSRRPRSTGDSW